MKSNNKLIAKNTLLLYFRMLLTMSVSLYTVRVVLENLGVVDFGLYNVVGGVVTMFSFISITLSSASQRYFSFELGQNNQEQLKKTFSMTLTIYCLLALVILILAETVGLWFLNTKMVIPENRMEAANWMYQFAILSFLMTVFTIPFNAMIIAHERMNVYAWVSIVEVLLKLLIAYTIELFYVDKLKTYAILTFMVTTIVTLIYRTYSKKTFKEYRFELYWNTYLFKELATYSGWNVFGALSIVFNNQGTNIILNLIFGTLVNAAQAIAYQVNGAINQFVQNFMAAARPQIIKYYAAGQKEQMLKLVFQSSKFSFLLLMIITMPVILETDFILSIWLKIVPKYVKQFTQLLIITALIDSLSYPLMTAAQATGKIKKYTSVVGGLMMLNLPISFLFLKYGYPPQTVFYIAIVNSFICLFARLKILKEILSFPISEYIREVIFLLLQTTIVAYSIPIFLCWVMADNIERFIIVGLLGFLISITSIYVICLTQREKSFFNQIIFKYYKFFLINDQSK